MSKNQGVYIIKNKINGKIYVGSTADTFDRRWKNHRKKLREGKHHSKHLQASWNKYGEENFEFKVLEVTEDNQCRKREGYYISLYNSCNPKFGYNEAKVDLNGHTHISEKTKEKLRALCKKQWTEGKFTKSLIKRKSSWNKGLKCPQISIARRQLFSSVEVYKNDALIATFRSVTDLDEWSKDHELPGLTYYVDKANRPNLGRRTTHLRSSNINRAIRMNILYRGLKFKKALPLSPEMGIVKWENCWNGETPNQQPSQPLTKLEGSETNS